MRNMIGLTWHTHRRYAPIRRLEMHGKSPQSPSQRSQGRFLGLHRNVAPRRFRPTTANRGTITSGEKAEANAGCYPRFGFGPRFPRKALETRFSHLAGDLFVSQPLSRDLRKHHVESVGVGDLLFPVAAMVITEHLLVKVAEQVKRFNAHISSAQAAFKQAPEVLKAVSVNLPVNVPFRVIYNLVRVIRSQSLIGEQEVGIE